MNLMKTATREFPTHDKDFGAVHLPVSVRRSYIKAGLFSFLALVIFAITPFHGWHPTDSDANVTPEMKILILAFVIILLFAGAHDAPWGREGDRFQEAMEKGEKEWVYGDLKAWLNETYSLNLTNSDVWNLYYGWETYIQGQKAHLRGEHLMVENKEYEYGTR